jgi:hypothetical protein
MKYIPYIYHYPYCCIPKSAAPCATSSFPGGRRFHACFQSIACLRLLLVLHHTGPQTFWPSPTQAPCFSPPPSAKHTGRCSTRTALACSHIRGAIPDAGCPDAIGPLCVSTGSSVGTSADIPPPTLSLPYGTAGCTGQPPRHTPDATGPRRAKHGFSRFAVRGAAVKG